MNYFKNTQEFYNSKLWNDIKEDLWNKRKNEQGEVICEHCGKPILRKYRILHHKQEIDDENVNNFSVSANYDNLAWLHFDCHNEVHKRFSSFERKVFLIVGSPCSGKSSWVKDVATKDDLILDVDRLWEAISINPIHVKSNRLTPIALALRKTMLDQITMRSGTWVNCYVLTTEPYSEQRRQMCIQLGVSREIHMETTENECMQRLEENANGRDKELYKKLIKKFYSRYQPEENRWYN